VNSERDVNEAQTAIVDHLQALDQLVASFSSFCASVFLVKTVRFFRELLVEHRLD